MNASIWCLFVLVCIHLSSSGVETNFLHVCMTFSCMPRVLNELLKLERLLFCSFHALRALKLLNAISLLTFLYDGRVAFILETLKVISKLKPVAKKVSAHKIDYK